MIQGTITGRASEPKVRDTRVGEVLSFGIACTPRRHNKNTGQWEDRGAPLWVEVTLFEQHAQRWREHIGKGTQVAISFEALALEEYETQAGERRTKLEAVGPRVLGIVPAFAQNGTQGAPGYAQAPHPQGQAWQGHTGQPATFADDTPPF